MNKDCKNRLKCRECNKRHPTVFHEFHANKNKSATNSNFDTRRRPTDNDYHESQDRAVSFCMSGSSNSKTTMIVPVHVSHRNNPHEVLVYAVLDVQSDASYVTEYVCDDLRVDGSKTRLLMSTMASSNTYTNCKKIAVI